MEPILITDIQPVSQWNLVIGLPNWLSRYSFVHQPWANLFVTRIDRVYDPALTQVYLVEQEALAYSSLVLFL
jgi:hypothetical protein